MNGIEKERNALTVILMMLSMDKQAQNKTKSNNALHESNPKNKQTKLDAKPFNPSKRQDKRNVKLKKSVKTLPRNRLESKSVGKAGRTACHEADRAGSKLESCVDGVYLSMSSEEDSDVVSPPKRRVTKHRHDRKTTRVVCTR